MFSQTVEYALRAVVHLAYESPEARTTAQIAEATRVPRDYLAKILQGLSKKGVVQTQRGVGGGGSLGRGGAAAGGAGRADDRGRGDRGRAAPADHHLPARAGGPRGPAVPAAPAA